MHSTDHALFTASAIPERKISNKESKHPTNEKPAMPKKKKRKAPKNEIDDIFGF